MALSSVGRIRPTAAPIRSTSLARAGLYARAEVAVDGREAELEVAFTRAQRAAIRARLSGMADACRQFARSTPLTIARSPLG